MESNNDILDQLYPYYESAVQFLIAYLNKTAYYPGIALGTGIVLQYVCGYGSKIRLCACYATYLLYPTFLCPITLPFFVLNTRAGVINCLYGAYLLRPLSKILGVEYEVRNGEILSEKTGTAVIVANHQSIFDVLGMFAVWPIMVKCAAVARKKVFYVWPFGLLAWLAGVVFIDRVPSNEKTYQTINEAAEYVCRQKAKLWMFPEGTRNKNPEKLLPFKKGAFRVAICCQVPIIPVVLSPYYFINGKKMYFGRGTVIIEALEPIPTKGLTLDDIEPLIEKVYNVMSAKNDELRKELKEKKAQGKLPCCVNL